MIVRKISEYALRFINSLLAIPGKVAGMEDPSDRNFGGIISYLVAGVLWVIGFSLIMRLISNEFVANLCGGYGLGFLILGTVRIAFLSSVRNWPFGRRLQPEQLDEWIARLEADGLDDSAIQAYIIQEEKKKGWKGVNEKTVTTAVQSFRKARSEKSAEMATTRAVQSFRKAGSEK